MRLLVNGFSNDQIPREYWATGDQDSAPFLKELGLEPVEDLLRTPARSQPGIVCCFHTYQATPGLQALARLACICTREMSHCWCYGAK